MIGRSPTTLRPVRPIRDGVIADFRRRRANADSLHLEKPTGKRARGPAPASSSVPTEITPGRTPRRQRQRAPCESERGLSHRRTDGRGGRRRPPHHDAAGNMDHRHRRRHDGHRGHFIAWRGHRPVRARGGRCHGRGDYSISRGSNTTCSSANAQLKRSKIRIGSAIKLDSALTMEVRGRHIGKGVPKKVVVSDTEIREALAEPLKVILKTVREALDQVPP